MQETKWLREKTKLIEDGYIIVFAENGVGVILIEVVKTKMVEVIRKSDPSITV